MKKIGLLAVLIGILFIGPNIIADNIQDYEIKNRINNSFLSSIDDGDDFLDQYYNEYETSSFGINTVYSSGQSFIPTYGILTRIKLHLLSEDDIHFDLHVYINGDINGVPFFHIVIPKENIPKRGEGDAEWIEIDFEDIIVNPGETYYIKLLSSISEGLYLWSHGRETEYTNGARWFHREGESWIEQPEYDMCFETYGRPNLKKTFIMGKIHDITSEGNYLTFNAIKIRCIQFNPFTFVTLQSDEELIISKTFKGIVAAGFVFAICDATLL